MLCAGERAGRAYAPFGETYAETGAADRSFTGQTQDVLAGPTGIYDFLFRQHASSQGRWLVPDPAGLAAVDITNPQTWNRYAYVGNNPLSNIDPKGLYDCDSYIEDCKGEGDGGGGGGGPDLGWVGYFFGGAFQGTWTQTQLNNWQSQEFFGNLWYDLPAQQNPKAQSEYWEGQYAAQVALSQTQFSFHTTGSVPSCSNTTSDLQVAAFPIFNAVQITSMTGTTTMPPNIDENGQAYSSSWSPVLIGGMSPINSAGYKPGSNYLYQSVLFQSPNNSPYPFTFNLNINVSVSNFNMYGNPSHTNVTVPETVNGLVSCGDAPTTH